MSHADLLLSQLDSGWDEVEATPEYINPPTGPYFFTCEKFKQEEKDSKTAEGGKDLELRFTFKVTSCIEPDATQEQKDACGQLFSVSYKGLEAFANFKRDFKPMLAQLTQTYEGISKRELFNLMNDGLALAGLVKLNTWTPPPKDGVPSSVMITTRVSNVTLDVGTPAE